MKEITIRNGSLVETIQIENIQKFSAVKSTIEEIMAQGNGVLVLEYTNKTITFPYLFLANSVIEYPKFD